MRILVLVAAIFFTGCASVSVQERQIDVDKLVSFKGKTLSITRREPQDFLKYTPKLLDGTSGIAGPLSAIPLGKKFAKENNIKDPAFDINKKLAIALQEKYGIVNTNKIIEVSSNKAEEIAAKNPDTNLILDFQTTEWAIEHSDEKCFFCSDDYVVTLHSAAYYSKAVLIDVDSKAIIAETGCAIPLTKNTDKKIPFEKITANHAELLKAMFAKASDDCMNKVKADLFGIRQ